MSSRVEQGRLATRSPSSQKEVQHTSPLGAGVLSLQADGCFQPCASHAVSLYVHPAPRWAARWYTLRGTCREKGYFILQNPRVFAEGRRGSPRAVDSATVESHGTSASVEVAENELWALPGQADGAFPAPWTWPASSHTEPRPSSRLPHLKLRRELVVAEARTSGDHVPCSRRCVRKRSAAPAGLTSFTCGAALLHCAD